MNTLVFDIETVPDTEGGRRLYGLSGLPDEEVVRAMESQRRQRSGRNFMPHHLHRVVAISVLFRHPSLEDGILVRSLGEPHSKEGELLRRFFEGIERYSPTLVSWNGSGFDLPVLHYRSLINGLPAARYWEQGTGDQAFRFNNYINRYHRRHTDLMDVLAGYNNNAFAPLDEIAILSGFPGKIGMDSSQVLESWLAGEIIAIRNYCDTDVLNTYGIYLYWLVNTGTLDSDGLQAELNRLDDYLIRAHDPHLQEFRAAWRGENGSSNLL